MNCRRAYWHSRWYCNDMTVWLLFVESLLVSFHISYRVRFNFKIQPYTFFTLYSQIYSQTFFGKLRLCTPLRRQSHGLQRNGHVVTYSLSYRHDRLVTDIDELTVTLQLNLMLFELLLPTETRHFCLMSTCRTRSWWRRSLLSDSVVSSKVVWRHRHVRENYRYSDHMTQTTCINIQIDRNWKYCFSSIT